MRKSSVIKEKTLRVFLVMISIGFIVMMHKADINKQVETNIINYKG